MKLHPGKTAKLGDIIVAAFDEAARLTSDPGEATFLATRAVKQLLQHSRRRTTTAVPRAHHP